MNEWVRRAQSPIALVTCAAFWLSLAWIVPRPARAQEAEPATNEPVPTTEGTAPTAAPTPEAKPAESVKAAGPTSPTSADPKAALPDVAQKAEAPTTSVGLPTGANKTGVSSQAISVPQGTGKIQGMGESFSAQLSTGIATFAVPFALPSARGGAQPSLGLSYSSGSGHGVAGVGWDLGVPFIARQTDRGVPQYRDGVAWTPQQDRFVFNGGQELVPICLVGSDCTGKLVDGEVIPASFNGWQYFRARVEGSFLRFFWSPDHKTWHVQSKTGEVMELGVPQDGTGYAGTLETDPSDASKIFTWKLARQYDANRVSGKPVNLVYYRYLNVGGVTYLTDVYDTTPVATPTATALSTYAHHTRLRYEVRPDPSFTYRRGWRVNNVLRLVGVDVASRTFDGTGGREMVRRYHLGYDAGYHVSLLSTVQMEGRCTSATAEDGLEGLPSTSCPLLPAMKLGYQHVTDGAGAKLPSTLVGYEGFDGTIQSMGTSPNFSLDDELTDLFDINADGLPDVLSTAGGYFGGNHGVFFNQGGDFAKSCQMPVFGALGEDATTITFKNLNLAAGDLDGDGKINLLHMPKVKTYSVYSAVPDGGADCKFRWQGKAVATASTLSPKIDFGKDSQEIRMVDVNGDGLVDAVYSSGTEIQTFFALGRLPKGWGQFGNGKFTSAATADLSNDPVRKCVPWAGTPVRFSDAEIKLADMNGDGLADIVKIQKGKIEYWPGRGDGTWGTGDPGSCLPGTFSSGGSIVMTSSPFFTEPSVAALRVDDVNGDGLDDLVQVRFSDVDVWLNVDGTGWTERHVISGTPAAPSYASRVRLVDVNGSGTRDILWGDGLNYRYIDLLGGKRPWVLTRVENGLGKTTDLEYSTSTQLMLAAAKAGKPWEKVAPMPLHVVVKETIRDNVSVAGRPPGVYVTEYTYRNPVYDGVQREFRGFEEAVVRRIGDANSPTASTRSQFLLGECKTPSPITDPFLDPCQPEGAWIDDPREALKGLPVLSEQFDEAGTYLSTVHHTYTLRTLYKGLDGRAVKHAFESASDTYLYDTGPFVPASAKASLPTIVEDASESHDVALRGGNRVHLATTALSDKFGNATSSAARGCIEGCGTGDEEITSFTWPARPSADPTGWMWRTVDTYVVGSKSATQRHRQLMTYDAVGRLVQTQVVLAGSLALDRFHAVSGKSVAPAPATASTDGTIDQGHQYYDALGNLAFSTGPLGRCRGVAYDPLFGDLATSETIYAGPATSVSTTYGTFTCGSRELTASAAYDRGLELVAIVTDLHGEKSVAGYDGFGRLTALTKPDPATGLPSARPSVIIEYELGTPTSRLHTRVHDGATPADDSYREAWAIVDGLGRTIATLDEADPLAGDGGGWVVNGFTDYDAKGAAQKAFLAWFWSGDPKAFSISTPPPSKYGRKRYDAFGRGLATYGLDGSTTLANVYHALSTDAWDSADLTPGPHYGTPASQRVDGHGRVVATVERIHDGSGVEEREIRTEYLPTGEVAKITRVRVGKPDAPVVRWMRYDTLGRMVLNVEPNTTKSFNADPAIDASTMKAWRYAYDDAGELVGTSDARGCGSNYHYDAAGRLTAEDYSPCLAHHPDYTAPDFTFGSESGMEVFNRYDTPPETTDVTGITTAEPACIIATGLYLGRLVSVSDRGQRTVTTYDGRGRVTCVARQMAKPGVTPSALADRYTPTWYVQTAKFDGADRPIEEGTGVYSLRSKVSQLLGGDGKSTITTSYTKRGSVLAVGSSYGALVTGVVHDADGLAVSIGYGDVAKTTTEYTYDDKRRLRTVQTFRGPPPIWSGTTISPTPTYGSGAPTTFQLLLEDTDFSYDVVDNPVEIRDWRSPGEWPAGSKPVTKKIGYDDLYRVNQVDYSYSAGDDTWVSPFAHENTAAATGATVDPRLAKPSPHVSFDKRVLRQTWTYDWLGNTTNTDDDAKGFYDRSLGGIVNGTAGAGPYQLKSAAQSVGPRAGSLTAKYDDAGYLTSLAVHRSGPCLPTAAKCSQRFVYDWDEAGRLQRARRWDLTSAGLAGDATPTGTPDAELRYQYDGGDQRTLKTSVDATGAERHTVYVLGSLELRRAEYSGGDYAIGPYTVVPYLFAHGVRLARLAWEDSDVPSIPTLTNPRLHVFFELGDHLGSSSTVLDKDTSELVEKSTYLPYGGAESDYRPGRWKGFREDHRFTGKEGDDEVGLTYFGFRYLAPALGRWLSCDPKTVHEAAADLNGFAYVHGRALTAVDPVGLDEGAGVKNGKAVGGLEPSGYETESKDKAKDLALAKEAVVRERADAERNTSLAKYHAEQIAYLESQKGKSIFDDFQINKLIVVQHLLEGQYKMLATTANKRAAEAQDKVDRLENKQPETWATDSAPVEQPLKEVQAALPPVMMLGAPLAGLGKSPKPLNDNSKKGQPTSHINGAIAEHHGWNHAKNKLGHVGVQAPGPVAAKGPDFITFDPVSKTVVVWDAKYRGPGGSYPAKLPDAKLKSWMPEVQGAVEKMAPGANRDAAMKAMQEGRVRGEIFRWPPSE